MRTASTTLKKAASYLMMVILVLASCLRGSIGYAENVVVAWGLDYSGQTNVPPGLTNVVAIASGHEYSLALKADGTVIGWGYDSGGQTIVPPGLTNVVAIAGGTYHDLALKSDGTVVAWGNNTAGQINIPSELKNTLVVALAGGVDHSLALKADGTVVAWGSMVSPPPGLSNVVAIASGANHGLALESDGTVISWGSNNDGQTNVPPGLTNVVAIAGGEYHSLALKADGTVFAWGNNTYGQTNVPAGLTNAAAIAGGRDHSMALKADGTVVLWGSSLYGQTNAPAELKGVFAIACGGSHSLALTGSPDLDLDEIPDVWELRHGLSPNDPTDAASQHPGDPLTYLQRYLYSLRPDADGDGLSDEDESNYGSNPLKADTSGGGIPDGWKVLHGLNPLLDNDKDEAGFNGVSYLQIYQYNLNHRNQLDPRNPFSQPGTSNYEFINGGQHLNRPYYDRNNRLVGLETSRGISIAYVYDGNNNLIRQTLLSRASETNGLPALWSFLNGFTNTTLANLYTDPDDDGWTNLQERKAGTDPNDPNDKPNLIFNPGMNIASLALPFTPTNFVAATGQLDGYGAEEIVIGADGNPNGTTNSLFILTTTGSGWATQRVDVGSVGITSIAIGQPTNRLETGIYMGLRQVGGNGHIVELTQSNGVWQMPTNVVAMSTNEAAFVLGVRGTNDLLGSFATNGLDGALFSLSITNANEIWGSQILSTNAGNRGLGTHGLLPSRIVRDASIRILDSEGIEIIGGNQELLISDVIIPSDAIYNSSTGKWYLETPDPMNWDSAQGYFSSLGGNLVTISSSTENSWILTTFPRGNWIGYYQDFPNHPNPPYPKGWISGSSSAYRNLDSLWSFVPFNGITFFGALMDDGNGQWNPRSKNESHYAIGNIVGPSIYYTNRWLLPEPILTANRINWRGLALGSGSPRPNQMNSGSIFYSFVDDKNLSANIDTGDDFVTVEYSISGNTVTTNTLVRIPITASNVAQSYSLASVNSLAYRPEVLFTAEPDGQIFSWQATNHTGPLHRQLFSSAHQGKAWHALSRVKLPEPGEGLIGLRIDPTNQTSCDVILWTPKLSFESPPDIPQTAPVARVLSSIISGGGLPEVDVDLRDTEGNASFPEMQFRVPSAASWSNATILTIDGLTPHAVAAQPGGSTHRIVWNALQNLGSGYNNQVLLRVRAADQASQGEWSGELAFQVSIPADNPVARDDSATTPEDTPCDIPVLANDSAANGKTLSITSVSQPANGSVTLNSDSTVRYSPQTDYFGTDGFTYSVSDGAGGAGVAAVFIAVSPVNDPPTMSVITDRTIVPGASTGPIGFSVTDVDGAPDELTVTGSASNLELIAIGGIVLSGNGASRILTVTPVHGQFGITTITITVTDIDGLSAKSSFTLFVNPLDRVGVTISAGSAEGAKGLQVTVPVKVDGFTNIANCQFTLRWDPAIVMFAGINQFGLEGLANENFGTDLVESGVLTISWDEPNGMAATLESWTELFAVNFLLIGEDGGNSTIQVSGNPVPIEINDHLSNVVPVQVLDGKVEIVTQVLLSGVVHYYDSETKAVPGVLLTLSGEETRTVQNGNDGGYAFQVRRGGDFIVKPTYSMEDRIRQGVTTFDIALIRRHILDIRKLDSPHKILAADVNDSESVSALDIAHIRQLILALRNDLPGGLWKFVPSDFGFGNLENPWPTDAGRYYSGLTSDAANQDFVAIKLGDANGSWTPPPHATTLSTGPRSDPIVKTLAAPAHWADSLANNRVIRIAVGAGTETPGRVLRVPILARSVVDLTSIQFTLVWDATQYRYAGITESALNRFDQTNLGESWAGTGKLPVSWDSPNGVGVNIPSGSSLFSVLLTPLDTDTSAKPIQISDQPTVREASVDFELAELQIENERLNGETTDFPSMDLSAELSQDAVILHVPTIRGRTVVLEYKTALDHQSWTVLRELEGDGTVQVVSDRNWAGKNRFYRSRLDVGFKP